jgi:mono/diheme cytochrome c family protein
MNETQHFNSMKTIKMKTINAFITTFLLGAAVTASAQSQTSSPAMTEGKSLYATYCANCHGDDAQGASKAGFDISIITERGGKQPPDLTDQIWDHGSTDAEIFKVIKEGKVAAMMPAYQESLSDAQNQKYKQLRSVYKARK